MAEFDLTIREFNALPYGEGKQDFSKLKKQVNEYYARVSAVTTNFIQIGFILQKIKADALYKNYPYSDNYNSKDKKFQYQRVHWCFETFVEDYFHLSKQYAYRLIAIAEKYGDSDKNEIRSLYKDYGVTKLDLLCQIEDNYGYDNVRGIGSEVTVKELKDKLKSLKNKSKDKTVSSFTATEIDNFIEHQVAVDFEQDTGIKIETEPEEKLIKVWSLSNDKKRLEFLQDYKNWQILGRFEPLGLTFYQIVLDKEKDVKLVCVENEVGTYNIVPVGNVTCSYLNRVDYMPDTMLSNNSLIKLLRDMQLKEVKSR